MLLRFQLALHLWSSTENVLTFLRGEYTAGRNPTSYNPQGDGKSVYWPLTGGQRRNDTDPLLLDKICARVPETVAHVRLQIAEPRVLLIQKDVKVTFPDMLGTIGKSLKIALPVSL